MWRMEGRDHYISIINAAGFQTEVWPKYKLSAQRVPKLDPLPNIFSIPDPARFSFENHWVVGNLKYWVLSAILGKPEASGIIRYFGYSQT